MTDPPLICPNCKSDQIDILSSGLWDGLDGAGGCACGVFSFGICKQCGSRCAQYIDGQPYVPTNDQWQSHFGPMEKQRRQVENWPFDPEVENGSVIM
jgi:hypothetical protein